MASAPDHFLLLLLLLPAAALCAGAVDVAEVRRLASRKNLTCILVFGDSSVDPGNNNRIATTNKGNFPPYGEDFLTNHHPSGRFCNGRLATDFIGDALGYTKIIRGFLDPHLTKLDMLHGVSFASAGCGYDDLTANLSSVISLSKQVDYLKHYKLQLGKMVGEKRTEEIVRNAAFVISMGTNDFLQNYFVEPTRQHQFTVVQYVDYLINAMTKTIKEMHGLGARRVVVVGVPPMGCIPLVVTLRQPKTKCDEQLNQLSVLFTTKMKKSLTDLRGSLGLQTSFVDIYTVISKVIQNPKPYGFEETSKGCCGTGTYEYGTSCRGLTTCTDRTKYVYWDAVHFTEKLYKMLADEALKTITVDLLS